MSKDFNKKTEIEELACKILESIINTFSQPKYLSQRHKENSEYYVNRKGDNRGRNMPQS